MPPFYCAFFTSKTHVETKHNFLIALNLETVVEEEAGRAMQEQGGKKVKKKNDMEEKRGHDEPNPVQKDCFLWRWAVISGPVIISSI